MPLFFKYKVVELRNWIADRAARVREAERCTAVHAPRRLTPALSRVSASWVGVDLGPIGDSFGRAPVPVSVPLILDEPPPFVQRRGGGGGGVGSVKEAS